MINRHHFNKHVEDKIDTFLGIFIKTIIELNYFMIKNLKKYFIQYQAERLHVSFLVMNIFCQKVA